MSALKIRIIVIQEQGAAIPMEASFVSVNKVTLEMEWSAAVDLLLLMRAQQNQNQAQNPLIMIILLAAAEQDQKLIMIIQLAAVERNQTPCIMTILLITVERNQTPCIMTILLAAAERNQNPLIMTILLITVEQNPPIIANVITKHYNLSKIVTAYVHVTMLQIKLVLPKLQEWVIEADIIHFCGQQVSSDLYRYIDLYCNAIYCFLALFWRSKIRRNWYCYCYQPIDNIWAQIDYLNKV